MYTSVFVLTTRHGDGLYASLSFLRMSFLTFRLSSCHRLICASLFAAVQMMRIIAFKLLSTLCHLVFIFAISASRCLITSVKPPLSVQQFGKRGKSFRPLRPDGLIFSHYIAGTSNHPLQSMIDAERAPVQDDEKVPAHFDQPRSERFVYADNFFNA